MGRTKIITKYEITPEIQELQALAEAVGVIGYSADVSISEDLITINGFKKFNRIDGKVELERILAESKLNSEVGTLTFHDVEAEAREARLEAKEHKKPREAGTPSPLKTLIRRSKRIWKKATNKGMSSPDASLKASNYIERKAKDTNDQNLAVSALVNYITKELK